MSEHIEQYHKNVPVGCNPQDPFACQTESGRYVNLWKFDASDVNRYDIVLSLGKICRFGGHCREFYSVAQHSVHVAERVYRLTGNPGQALLALYHDAHEAYTGDIPRPIKRHEAFRGIRDLMDHIQREIEQALSLTRYITTNALHAIKQADNDMLFIEAVHLMKGGGRDWNWPTKPEWTIPIIPLAPSRACEFMHNYDAELRELIATSSYKGQE